MDGYFHTPRPHPLVRHSSHLSHPPNRNGCSPTSLLTSLDYVQIPFTYKQASAHKFWQTAMTEQLEALHYDETWDLVPCPPQINPFSPVAKITAIYYLSLGAFFR